MSHILTRNEPSREPTRHPRARLYCCCMCILELCAQAGGCSVSCSDARRTVESAPPHRTAPGPSHSTSWRAGLTPTLRRDTRPAAMANATTSNMHRTRPQPCTRLAVYRWSMVVMPFPLPAVRSAPPLRHSRTSPAHLPHVLLTVKPPMAFREGDLS